MIGFKQQAEINLALIYFLSLGVGDVSQWMASQHVSCDVRFLLMPYVFQLQASVITYLYLRREFQS